MVEIKIWKEKTQEMRKRRQTSKNGRGHFLCRRTFIFAQKVVGLCKLLENKRDTSRRMRTQLLNSGTSVGANVEEAQGAQSLADFIHKYALARKEAREARYWLRLLITTEVAPVDDVIGLLDECNQLIAILTAVIKKCEKKLPPKKT